LSFLTRSREPAPAAAGGVTGGRRRGVRLVAARAVTVLAGLLVLLALITPNQITRLPPGASVPAAFLRIPLEGLLGAAVLLALPPRARRVVAPVAGAALGLLSIIKIVDMGFFAVLARPFDPVLDWVLLDDAFAFLTDSIGRSGAIGVVVAGVGAAVALLVTMTLSVRRLAGTLTRHRTASTGTVAASAGAWVTCALLGVHFVPGVWVSADSAAVLAYDTAKRIPAGMQDRDRFAAEAAADPFRDTPGEQLLTGLRGKDVVFSFVESYGRSAIENPEYAAQVGAVLDAGTRRLAAAGFAARSGFLTSPTAGGGSWLAHATFLSGVWINNEQRYRSLVSSDRLALTGAFRRASWRTVGIEPGLTYAWPEGEYYGYDKIYDSHSLGYRGPKFSWATMPDQYTLSAFRRLEHGRPDGPPLMAEITLVSSHTPWAPVPRMVGWDEVGDGSVYGPMVAAADSPEAVWRDNSRVRAEYRRAVEYSLQSLISYVEKYGDDDLVLVFLGDHEPAPLVTGTGAGRDVPITIVTRDRAVLDQISGWGWQDGLRPGPQAPVWPMNAFRDRFLTAFGPQAGHLRAPGAAGHR
jgi:hypothetical protein